MIFVCLGTKRFQFNRLLEQIDILIAKNIIIDEVFAQTGSSTYKPLHFKFSSYLSAEDYSQKVNTADVIITHGGTGAIVKALKAHKQVIAAPRLKKYNEHSDDHQLEIVDFFANQGLIEKIHDMEELERSYVKIVESPIKLRFKGNGQIIDIISDFIK